MHAQATWKSAAVLTPSENPERSDSKVPATVYTDGSRTTLLKTSDTPLRSSTRMPCDKESV